MKRLIAIALLLSGILAAQPPRGYYPWWDRPVAKDLNLTPAQTQQIRMTVREYRDKLIGLRGTVQKSELDFQDLFDDETIDQKKAEQAIDNLAHARENLTRAFSEMSLKLRLVLTAQQWKELQKRRESEAPTRGKKQ
jgi:Spy/CpxP family protein refolding chaperone